MEKYRYPALFTDLYELTMLAGYFEEGMHEEPAVFDLFYRGSTGQNVKGMGVGLATVQKIAHLFGGRTCLMVRVTSEKSDQHASEWKFLRRLPSNAHVREHGHHHRI